MPNFRCSNLGRGRSRCLGDQRRQLGRFGVGSRCGASWQMTVGGSNPATSGKLTVT